MRCITPGCASPPNTHHPRMRITTGCASHPRMRITPGLVWSGHMHSENMWFVWFKTSYSGQNVGCHVCGRTHGNVKIELESCRIRNLLFLWPEQYKIIHQTGSQSSVSSIKKHPWVPLAIEVSSSFSNRPLIRVTFWLLNVPCLIYPDTRHGRIYGWFSMMTNCL